MVPRVVSRGSLALSPESCQESSGLQVEIQEAWRIVGMAPDLDLLYDDRYTSLNPC